MYCNQISSIHDVTVVSGSWFCDDNSKAFVIKRFDDGNCNCLKFLDIIFFADPDADCSKNLPLLVQKKQNHF